MNGIRRNNLRPSGNAPLAREMVLRMKLREAQLDIRGDSHLCRDYILGTSEFLVDEIISRMCIMRYLYNYTQYLTIKRQVYSELQGPVARGYVSNEARTRALRLHPPPAVWPWLEEKMNPKLHK